MECTKLNCPMNVGTVTDSCSDNCPWRTTVEYDDLISRSAAISALCHTWMPITAIRELPPVDAVPVVHGRWIEQEDCNGDSYYTCSACGCDWSTIDGTPTQNNMRYCPECGARMDVDYKNGEDK